MSKYPGALAILMDMGFPLTQLSKAKFVSGVRVCISIRDQRERLCIGGVGVFYTNTPTKNNLNVMKVGVPNAELGINLILIYAFNPLLKGHLRKLVNLVL